jgi:hypothetical protein
MCFLKMLSVLFFAILLGCKGEAPCLPLQVNARFPRTAVETASLRVEMSIANPNSFSMYVDLSKSGCGCEGVQFFELGGGESVTRFVALNLSNPHDDDRLNWLVSTKWSVSAVQVEKVGLQKPVVSDVQLEIAVDRLAGAERSFFCVDNTVGSAGVSPAFHLRTLGPVSDVDIVQPDGFALTNGWAKPAKGGAAFGFDLDCSTGSEFTHMPVDLRLRSDDNDSTIQLSVFYQVRENIELSADSFSVFQESSAGVEVFVPDSIHFLIPAGASLECSDPDLCRIVLGSGVADKTFGSIFPVREALSANGIPIVLRDDHGNIISRTIPAIIENIRN